MTRHLQLVALGLAFVLGACSKPEPEPLVPVMGPGHQKTAVLAGHWLGQYESARTGRTGTIDITVLGTGDSASGVIRMIPANLHRPLEPWVDPALKPAQPSPAAPEPLTIRLIWVEGNKVTGVMAPYSDPQTGERLITTYDGRLAGDTIAGTFITRPGATPGEVTGSWRVVRER